MQSKNTAVSQRSVSALATNRVLRNTYLLLGLTFLFSAATASYAMINNAGSPGIILLIVGMYGLMFLTQALRNSIWGLVSIFAFTGFMGYTLGPVLNHYIAAFNNGPQLISTALGGTGVIFFALSGYALSSQKDFSYMGGFLFAAIVAALLASIGGLFFNIPLLQLVVSAAFILISSGMILMQTSEIIHGGERNYIMATISLYVSLFNLFISLLQILSAFAGNKD